MLVDIPKLAEISVWRILGECLLISSLPGKALRMLVDITRLDKRSTCVLKAQPGKLVIKRRKTSVLFISLLVGSLCKLAVLTVFLLLCHSVSLATSLKKCHVITT